MLCCPSFIRQLQPPEIEYADGTVARQVTISITVEK